MKYSFVQLGFTGTAMEKLEEEAREDGKGISDVTLSSTRSKISKIESKKISQERTRRVTTFSQRGQGDFLCLLLSGQYGCVDSTTKTSGYSTIRPLVKFLAIQQTHRVASTFCQLTDQEPTSPRPEVQH